MIVKNFEKQEKSMVSFDVLCDAGEFEKAIQTVYLQNKSQIYVQGFRKGKAPRMVIEGMYGKDIFYEDAADDLAPNAFEYAVKDQGLQTVGRPSVTHVDFGEEKDLTISFLTAVWPEVTLGEYKGLEAPMAKVEITEEQVDEELERLRKRNARIVAVERPAQEGDTAVIDYEGSVDGVPFDGGADEGYGLELGSHTFIPGFEEQVVGMSAGEEKDIQVTFPEDYQEPALAGKPAVFHVKVSEVKEEQLPELDDEFVKDVSEFDTLAEYCETLKNRMESSEKSEAEANFQSALIEKAGDNMTADIPEAMIEEEIDRVVQEYDQNLQMSGMSLEMYLQYMGQDLDAFRSTCRRTAERRVKTDLVLDKIAEVEGVEVTEEAITEEYEKMSDSYDVPLDEVKEAVPEEAVIRDIKARRAAEIIFQAGIPVEPAEETLEDGDTTEEEKDNGEEDPLQTPDVSDDLVEPVE